MADYLGIDIEIDLEFEFGFSDVAAASNVASTPGVEIPEPEIEFGLVGVADAASIASTPGIEIPNPEILFGLVETVPADGARVADTIGSEIALLVRTYPDDVALGGDTLGIEIDVDEVVVPVLPVPPVMTEILYPVVPLNEVNKVLFKTDSQEWRVAQKTTSPVVRRRSTVRFRVDTSYLATFLGDLHANRTEQFRLQTAGFTPFGVESEDNYVRLLRHSAPSREIGGLTYLVDVEFLFMATYA